MKLYISLFLFCIVAARPDGDFKTGCGYDSCHPTKEGVLNVHLVPHSHDDVGWLKTVDQYYYGSRTLTQRAGVQYIIDSVIDELMKDPTRRFVYVETAFFNRWWMQQHDQRRHHVRRLVSEGRLEFAGGAWSMNDEATVHYQSVIDQLTWGLRMLNDTFGECGRPRAGWQIDPFGHSRELANIWALAGFDGLLFGRADYREKKQRWSNKEAEMIWRGSDDIGKSSDLFTGILFNRYSPPPGFCYDVLCSDDPIIDDKRSPDYNVDKLVKKFIDYVKNQANSYKTNNIILTMGEDFNYQNALMWYKNLDKLIKYVNLNDSSMNLIYSTPSCYIKSLYDANTTWPIKQDDFFPYASDSQSYWSGYFTSRPTIKYFERRGNNFLQACKQLYALTNLNEKDKIDLNMLRSAMGVMQHHDAVSGTEKQHVAYDYARMLSEGIEDCLITSKEALNILMAEKKGFKKAQSRGRPIKSYEDTYLPMSLCQLNISECEITENNKNMIITVYNPMGHVVSDFVKIPVSSNSYSVKDPLGSEVVIQISSIQPYLINQLPSRKSNATNQLLFAVENLPPMGYRSYYIEEIAPKNDIVKNKKDIYYDRDEMLSDARSPVIINSNQQPSPETFRNTINKMKFDAGSDFKLGNDFVQIEIDPNTGLVDNIIVTDNGEATKIPLSQQLLYYEGMPSSTNSTFNRPSGAYIFRPKTQKAIPISGKPQNTIVRGPLCDELHQQFSDWASQIIRICIGSQQVEFEWLVGPIPITDRTGKEIISRFTTDFKTNGEFYTDSNGRQMLKRVINKRPTFNFTTEEPVAGNYYPVTSMISIEDKGSKRKMYVLNDRAQGGASLIDGQVELMVHRRLLYDDSFGVGEPLNETENGIGLVARGSHYLLIGDDAKKSVPLAVTSRQLALKKLLQPIVFVSPANNLTFNQWATNKNEFSGIHTELPANVHLLTLEPWKDRTILMRLEHFLQKTDDPNNLSKQAFVNLWNFFPGIKILSFRETTLAANQWKQNDKRFEWKTSRKMVENFNKLYDRDYEYCVNSTSDMQMDQIETRYDSNIRNRDIGDDSLVYLNPMEIKTLIIKASFYN